MDGRTERQADTLRTYTYKRRLLYMYVCMYIYVCVCDSIGLLRETIHINICIILNGYRGRAV